MDLSASALAAVHLNCDVVLCRGRALACPTHQPTVLGSTPTSEPGSDSNAIASGIQILFICLLFLASALDAYAQSASTGALTGTVTDPTGAVLQSARITLRNKATDETRTAITDQSGLYRFSLLPPGEYELSVEAVGFAPLMVREVLIRITEVRRLATQLAVKGVQQELVVKAPLLQTDNVALGRVIARDTIVGLPLVNRNYTQILGLTAGTNTDIVDATLLGAGSQEVRANGARSSDNNFMLNGVDANSYGGNMTEATNYSGGGWRYRRPIRSRSSRFRIRSTMLNMGAEAAPTCSSRPGRARHTSTGARTISAAMTP